MKRTLLVALALLPLAQAQDAKERVATLAQARRDLQAQLEWRKWNEAMFEAIVKHQHMKGSGSRTGSWDPLCAWGEDGGRVYSTALLTMCLEVYYRYDRVFGVK